MNAKANYTPAVEAFDCWRDDVLSGKPPTRYRIGTGDLESIEVGPGLVTLIGGAPGAGKTAFTMQAVIDALRFDPSLRAVVANIEMPPAVLLDRQLSRLSGIDLQTIRFRKCGAEHGERLAAGFATLESVADRLAFVRPPFDLGNVAATADTFDASLLVLDYIQRIAPPGEHDTKRGSVDASMNYLRQFADAGVAVIVISAVSRSKDAKGRSSYSGEGLNLASFRESSELEFGADDAFILHPDDGDPEGDTIRLKHLKSRHGEADDVLLQFDRPRQRFTPQTPPDDRLQSELRAMWERTASAEGGEDDPD